MKRRLSRGTGCLSGCCDAVWLTAVFAFLLLPLLASPAAADATPTPAPPLPNPQFGVIESSENPAAATELGVGWTRLIFHWGEIQAGGPDSWTPKFSDAEIDAELAAGREVVGLLIGIPDWARDERLLPRGLWFAVDDPENSWATFVRQVVLRYNGRINHWIIWNEPDIAASEIAHTWDGSVADFAQLQRVAYLTAKATNPAAVIHLSAFTYWADVYAGKEQYMARLLDELLADPAAAAHNAYFDVATAHLYFQPAQIYDLLLLFQEIMRQRGLTQPIWLVETNAPPVDDPTWPVRAHHLYVTQTEQAAFVPQALAVALAAGAQRISLYKLQDTPTDRAANPEPFGLLRLNGQRRPAFATYRVAVQYLAQAQQATWTRRDGIGQVDIVQPDRITAVLFNRLFFDQEAAVTAAAPTALLVDQWGNARTITATQGVYTIPLPAAPCSQPIGDYCMIGGPTFYLVQARDGGDVPPLPVPTITPSATPTVTPTPTLTVAPTATSTPTPTLPPTITPTIPLTNQPASLTNQPTDSTNLTSDSPIHIGYLFLVTAVTLAIGLWLRAKRAS